LASPSEFATYVPFPTLAADDPRFRPRAGYWRGPVWLDQAYFAVAGLRSYGFLSEAGAFEQSLIDHTQAGAQGDAIRETYNPSTGAGQNAADFSWSAASFLLLIAPPEDGNPARP
jgi:putative isomerase